MSFALETPVVVSPDDERKLNLDLLPRLGARPEECSIHADALTEGDLRSHHFHGLQLKRVNAEPEFKRIEDMLLSAVCCGLLQEDS
jgi:hypothetical protein